MIFAEVTEEDHLNSVINHLGSGDERLERLDGGFRAFPSFAWRKKFYLPFLPIYLCFTIQADFTG